MKPFIPLLLSLLVCTLLSSCAQNKLHARYFNEVTIRNTSNMVLENVRLQNSGGDNNGAMTTNAIYPYSDFTLGFPERQPKASELILFWSTGGRDYQVDIAPYMTNDFDKKEVYKFVVLVGYEGQVQTTFEVDR